MSALCQYRYHGSCGTSHSVACGTLSQLSVLDIQAAMALRFSRVQG